METSLLELETEAMADASRRATIPPGLLLNVSSCKAVCCHSGPPCDENRFLTQVFRHYQVLTMLGLAVFSR
jgi:hypothetical protein